jgi:hypothetical protein
MVEAEKKRLQEEPEKKLNNKAVSEESDLKEAQVIPPSESTTSSSDSSSATITSESSNLNSAPVNSKKLSTRSLSMALFKKKLSIPISVKGGSTPPSSPRKALTNSEPSSPTNKEGKEEEPFMFTKVKSSTTSFSEASLAKK